MEVIKRLLKVNLFQSSQKVFYEDDLTNILHTILSDISCSESAI